MLVLFDELTKLGSGHIVGGIGYDVVHGGLLRGSATD